MDALGNYGSTFTTKQHGTAKRHKAEGTFRQHNQKKTWYKGGILLMLRSCSDFVARLAIVIFSRHWHMAIVFYWSTIKIPD
jgi:hypothetical protein